METQQQYFSALCQALEEKMGKRMHTSKDFEALAASIFEQTHQLISASTLKRLWGYLDEGVTPRRTTLDLLSQFLGYAEWDAFCEQQTEGSSADSVSGTEAAAESTASEPQAPPVPANPAPVRKVLWGILALLCLVALVLVLLWRQDTPALPFDSTEQSAPTAPTVADKYILKKGQTFESYEDYLRLFGITANELWWYQPVPHHEGIKVWGPQYQHPNWHNEGNPDSLMPTITEYWEPTTPCQNEEAKMVLERMHAESYYLARNLNDVRLTFMRGLKGSTFTFLGVYRMSLEKSDSTRLVYERIADECDLRALDYLEQLRR